MKTIRLLPVCLILAFGLLLSPTKLAAQSGAIAVMDSATLEQQLDYIINKTRIYDNYRAIREDVIQKLRKNVVDSLNVHILNEERLRSELDESGFEVNKLNTDLQRISQERDEAIRSKDSMTVLGIQMNKPVYNSVMWFIILGLALAAAILFVLFKRAHTVTREVRDELGNLQEEYESYRKTSREKYEKLVVSHHNEITRLKNS